MGSEYPTIKSQLLDRFTTARKAIGRNWRKKLSSADPYFNTEEGMADMTSVGQSIGESQRRGQVDRLKRVVLAMEKVGGIPHQPIL